MGFEVVLICDHKWRDLPGLAWLKLQIERAHPSWRVALIPKSLLAFYTEAFLPSVLVIPTSNGAWLRVAEEHRRRGAITVILPTEGRPSYGKLLEWSVSSHDGCQADGVLLWSPLMKEVFERAAAPSALRAAVVGPTRFDFYRQPLRALLPDRATLAARLGAPADRPIVGWPTTFTSAKFYGKNEDWQLEDWRRMNLGKVGMTDDVMRRMIKSEYDDRAASLACLERCARALPRVTFCLKPHPYEDFEYHEERVAAWRADGLDNIYLVRGLYIWDLLNACSAHVHRACTTGTEAWLLGKPTVELGFIAGHLPVLEAGADQAGAAQDAERAEDVAGSPDDVVDRLGHYLAGGAVDPALTDQRRAYADKWFSTVDGRATRRAVDRIGEWAGERRPARNAFWRRRGLRRRLTIRFKEWIGFPFDESLRRPGPAVRSEFDRIGHWDRTICQRDVREWTRRLDGF